jgi:hypothetical protein
MTALQRFRLAGFTAGMLFVAIVGGTWLLTDSLFWRCCAGLAYFAAGYLTYEFGHVLRSTPAAFQHATARYAVVSDSVGAFTTWLWSDLRIWFGRPHPFGYLALALVIPLIGFSIRNDLIYGFLVHKRGPRIPIAEYGLYFYMGRVFMVTFLFSFFLWAILYTLAAMGATWKERRWSDAFESKQYQKVYLTYGRGYLWLCTGIARSVWFWLWTFWSYLIPFLWEFGTELLRLIHSNQRLMIAVDGSAGGLLAMTGYMYFGPASATFTDYFLTAFFGGIFASVIVVITVRYVAPRFGFRYVPHS